MIICLVFVSVFHSKPTRVLQTAKESSRACNDHCILLTSTEIQRTLWSLASFHKLVCYIPSVSLHRYYKLTAFSTRGKEKLIMPMYIPVEIPMKFRWEMANKTFPEDSKPNVHDVMWALTKQRCSITGTYNHMTISFSPKSHQVLKMSGRKKL